MRNFRKKKIERGAICIDFETALFHFYFLHWSIINRENCFESICGKIENFSHLLDFYLQSSWNNDPRWSGSKKKRGIIEQLMSDQKWKSKIIIINFEQRKRTTIINDPLGLWWSRWSKRRRDDNNNGKDLERKQQRSKQRWWWCNHKQKKN